jgi:hypothetical protein
MGFRGRVRKAERNAETTTMVLAVAMACWCGERYLRKENSLPRPGVIVPDAPINIFSRR